MKKVLSREMFSKTSIRVGLLSLMLLNVLFGASGGIMLHAHHDLSFHFGSEVEANGSKTDHASDVTIAGHDPHHHEIHLVIDELPVFRANKLPKIEVSAPITTASVQPDSFQWPMTPSKETALIRGPPEVMPSHLEIIRMQVLRI